MNNLEEPIKQAIVQPDLVTVLNELVAQLKRPNIEPNDELWTSEDIGRYLKLSTVTVERRVVVQPEFPEAVQPCQTGQRAARRWFADEVKKWAQKNRSSLPQRRRRAID